MTFAARTLAFRCPALAVPLLAAALAAPAAADNQALLGLVRSAGQPAEAGGYLGGIAACVLGGGVVEATAALFTETGWTREDDTEMGLIYLSGPQGDLGATVALDGSFCEVASEAIGTETARAYLVATLAAAGASQDLGTDPFGCTTHLAAPGVTGTVTSTGQDPVCEDAGTSAVRVTFGRDRADLSGSAERFPGFVASAGGGELAARGTGLRADTRAGACIPDSPPVMVRIAQS
jgi:hypothetical protein